MAYRTQEENRAFVSCIYSAIDEINNALLDINSYPYYPEDNKEVITKMRSAIAMLRDVANSSIQKP